MALTMSPEKSRAQLAFEYEAFAQKYLHSLPLEHFMEAIGQSTQRKISWGSLDLLAARRSDVHVFNELLVQYPVPGKRRPGQVVSDNMVVVSTEPVKASSSFNLPLESAKPFWVLEYVSKNNKRKDYEDNFVKYERDLKVPYYLIFAPEEQDLRLYHHTGKKYVAVVPNEQGRLPIPELELELCLLDGWVRFWYQGELLPLPAEMQRELNKTLQSLANAEAEIAQLRAALEQQSLRVNGRKSSP